MTIYDEIAAERARAHAKHGAKSMESAAPDDMKRFRILSEEVGEVAREFNEADIHDRPVDLAALRAECIQVAAMAAAWADACHAIPPLSCPSTIEARALSGVHVGRTVRLPDGTEGVLSEWPGASQGTSVLVCLPLTGDTGLVGFPFLAPSDVVELVEGGDDRG